MLTSVLCVCVVTNILHEGLHIVSFYLGCCTSNYNLPATLSPGEGIFTAAAAAVAPTSLDSNTALFIAIRTILYYNIGRKNEKERTI